MIMNPSDREMLTQYREERRGDMLIYPYVARYLPDESVDDWIKQAERPSGGALYAVNAKGFLDWAITCTQNGSFWEAASLLPCHVDLDYVDHLVRDFKKIGVRAIYSRELTTMMRHGLTATHVYAWLHGTVCRNRDVWAVLALANILYQVEMHAKLGPRNPFTGVLIEPEGWLYSSWWNDQGIGPRYIEVEAGIELTSFYPVSWRIPHGDWFCGFVSEKEQECWQVLFHSA